MRSSVDRFPVERTADSMRDRCRSSGLGTGRCDFMGNHERGAWRSVHFTVESEATTINPANRCASTRNSR